MQPKIFSWTSFVAVFIVLQGLETEADICMYHDGKPDDGHPVKPNGILGNGGEVLPNNRTIRCMEDNNFCFTFWTVDPANSTKKTIAKQGCWIAENDMCEMNLCRSNTPPKRVKHNNEAKFCCCSGDRCNENVTDVYDPSLHTTETPPYPVRPVTDPNYREKTIIISLVSVLSVALIILIVYFVYRMFVMKKRPSLDSLNIVEVTAAPGIDLDNLKLCSVVSKGRYSEVWHGLLGNEEVAVKIYQSHHRQYHNNERILYSYPFMEHDNLLRFYGSDERLREDGTMQYLLVLTYVPGGSLMAFLKNNTVSWQTMCKMCYTVVNGLAHLHTDITKGDKFKAAMAHRDFNTRNILVKTDLSCTIADLGFCIPMMGSKLIKNGQAENAEQSTLTDVGTVRYMAPELLDGAVNLRDCEASLKQIDIYALGLVLWEISQRCSDLYQGAPVPEYMLPYQAEVGAHPSFEEMQVLVSRNKARPKFPEIWKDTNQAIRFLRETIEDCWDSDAEARLTTLCVEMRISEIMTTWCHDTRHRGVTPTLNPTLNITQDCPNKVTTTTGLSDDHGHNIDIFSTNMVDYRVPISSPTETSTALLLGNSNHWPADQSMSGSTMDTLLPASPSESEPLPPKTNNLQLARSNIMLQPHQGRNPTVDRNTHKRSDEELTISGNQLVIPGMNSPPGGGISGFDSVNDDLETSLVQNDALNQHRLAPIPYLQNQVHGDRETHTTTTTTTAATQPKVANLPGNNNSVPYRQLQSCSDTKSIREKVGRFFKTKNLGGKLSWWSLFSSKSRSNRHGDVEVDANGDDDVQRPLNPMPNAAVVARETEVRLQHNGHVYTRPSNLVLENAVLAQARASRAVEEDDVDLTSGGTTSSDDFPHGSSSSSSRDHYHDSRNDLQMPRADRVDLNGGGTTSSDDFPHGSSSHGYRDLRNENQTCRKSVPSENKVHKTLNEGSLNGTTATHGANSAKSNSSCYNSANMSQSNATRLPTGASMYAENRLGFAEVGIARLMNIGQPTVIRQKGSGQSHSASNLSPTNGSDSSWQELKMFDSVKKPRPTSLALCSNNYREDKNGVGMSAPNVSLKTSCDECGSDSTEKIRRRIKTPVRVKDSKVRLSLYDDRLMAYDGDKKNNNNNNVVALKTTSHSLHQLKHYGIVGSENGSQVV
ncbi:uncharacterized protein LOC121385295 [Gigantopelta aegis]|uniref:uncharacterized protein LOC121385295 n=1 Tax=Gigantopelta aegis TaxID=1735272 RepID=UPI001B88869C|nr:uncharacterized protein LOC121385295 [Gigantopelta aegis]